MRILHVVAGPADGRARAMLADGAAALSDTGLEQRVLAPPDCASMLEKLRQAGVGVAYAPFDPVWRAPTRKALGSEITQFEPHVIQYWGGRAARFAAARHKGRSLLWHPGYTKSARIKSCQWHCAPSPNIADHVRAMGIDASRVVAWNAFVPPHDGPSAERVSWKTPENAPVVLCLARLHVKQGLDVLLRALVRLEGVHAWLAGDGPDEADLRALAAALGLKQRAHFLGKDANRSALLAQCDVIAVPAREDPLGFGVLEAWAAKRPVVAAQADGPAAIVTHERDGLLVACGDEAALAQGLRRALEDGELAMNLIANGARRFAKGHTQSAFTRTALSLYERVDRAARVRSKTAALAEPHET